MSKGIVIKASQLNLFDTDESRLEKMITPCYWVESFWNPGEWWVYQDAHGYTMSDDYGRHIHYGTMLPAVVKNYTS